MAYADKANKSEELYLARLELPKAFVDDFMKDPDAHDATEDLLVKCRCAETMLRPSVHP